MAKHRTHSTDFKRQVVQEYLAGETLHGLADRHDLSRNLIRIWIETYQSGGLDEDAAAADLLQSYEARIAALERLVGKQALELEFLKGAPRAELLARRRFRSHAEARMAWFSYIEGWYNPHRRHSAPGYLSPVVFERSRRLPPPKPAPAPMPC